MKRLAIVMAAAALMAGCGTEQTTPRVDRDTALTVGRTTSDSLKVRLSGALMQAVQDSGLVGALAFCNVKALPLTAAVAGGDARVVSVGRTSRKVRNIANRPDSLDQVALAWFEARMAGGEGLPADHLVDTGDGQYRYYQPLKIAPLCVNCHGPRESLDPLLQAELDKRYPQDEAVGYGEGDFRGLIRITVGAAGP